MKISRNQIHTQLQQPLDGCAGMKANDQYRVLLMNEMVSVQCSYLGWLMPWTEHKQSAYD
jgi:hypothetical protein